MTAISRAEYQLSVCKRIAEARHVPFRKVELKEWHPQESRCHENVAIWTTANPGTTAVHGWVTVAIGLLAAHSVVRDVNGRLYDITPFADESIRPTARFIPHLGDENEFWEIHSKGVTIHYF